MMGGYDCGGMMNGMGTFGFPMGGGALGWIGMLVQILFWAGILVLIAWAIMRIFPQRHSEGSEMHRGETAEEILGQRFARGEIDEKEYQAKRHALSGGG